MNREELLEELSKRHPKSKFRTSEEFSKDMEGGIWTSGEDFKGEDLPLFNYYNESSSYIFGVKKSLHNWLEKRGWYCEWYDPGTVMIWKD